MFWKALGNQIWQTKNMVLKVLNNLNAFKKEVLEAFLNLFWPPVCFSCQKILTLQEVSSPNKYYCLSCLAKINIISGEICKICGRPFWGQAEEICSDCLKYPPIFHKAKAAVFYNEVITKSISDFKYGLNFYQVKALASIYKYYMDINEIEDFDMIIPIPLSKKKMATRGFNQAYELAKEIFKSNKVKNNILLKVKEPDLSQVSLSAQERKLKILNSFQVRDGLNLKGLKIMVFDDVLTTGATANEASKVLIQKGASKVELRTLARTKAKRWLNEK